MTDLTVISLLLCAIVLAYIACLVLDKIARQDSEISALTDAVSELIAAGQRNEHRITELHFRLATLEADLEEAIAEYEQEGATIQ